MKTNNPDHYEYLDENLLYKERRMRFMAGVALTLVGVGLPLAINAMGTVVDVTPVTPPPLPVLR